MGKIAASVLLKLFVNGNDAHLRMGGTPFFKCKELEIYDPRGPENIYHYTMKQCRATEDCEILPDMF